MKTPTSEGAYPFLVTVESTSRGGLRSSGEPPRLDIVTVRYQAGDLVTHNFGQFGPIGIPVGSVTGNVVTVRGEEEIIRSFSIQFRSAQVMLGETPCGGNQKKPPLEFQTWKAFLSMEGPSCSLWSVIQQASCASQLPRNHEEHLEDEKPYLH